MSAREALGLLGLAAPADQERLRGAYLAAVKAVHPDRPGGDDDQLRRVIEAYDVLRANPAPGAGHVPRPASRTLDITPCEAMTGGVRAVPLEGGGEVQVRLAPGLRVGDIVAVCGVAMTVAIPAGQTGSIVGDHLCMALELDSEVQAAGGSLQIATPRGMLKVSVTPQDIARGLIRLAGEGLPARGAHRQGDLIVRLKTRTPVVLETRTRTLLRRFTAAWAA